MRGGSVLIAAVVASCMVAGTSVPMSAAGWDDPIVLSQLAADKGVLAGDIAAHGNDVVVGWDEVPTSGARAVYLRWTTNGGTSFRPRVRLDSRPQREVQVDVCGGWAWAASSLYVSGSWLVALDKRRLTGSESEQSVLTLGGESRQPDVACAGHRLVVAWFQRVGDQWRVKLHARGVHDEALGDSLPAFGADLGPGSRSRGLSVAATADHVYVAWFQGSDLKLRRYRISTGPAHQLSSLGTTTLTHSGGSMPRLGAYGKRVAIAYGGGDVLARTSTDRGASWGSWRTLAESAFEIFGYPGNVDVSGSRVIVTLTEEGVGWGTSLVKRSTNDGHSWSEVSGSDRPNGRMVSAMMVDDGAIKIVQAWDQSITEPTTQRVRFRRQS